MKQFVLPLEKTIYDVNIQIHKIAIAIHLYYMDQMDDFINLVNEIPLEIDVYIISSDQKYLNDFTSRCMRKIYTELKSNQGRDVSALLICFASKAKKYEYVCFLHDKKESEECLAKDVAFWNRNLRENTIGSSEYINNIIGVFEGNPNIGVIIPPAPIGDYYSTWLGEYPWESVFEQIIRLKHRLQLSITIDKDNPNVSIGGVLWFRYDALIKIMEYPWKYSDFPKEPMPTTGTISHAIERIYPYIAKDAGYDTVCAMSNRYAESMLEFLQISMSKAMQILKQGYGVHTISQFENAIERKENLNAFCKENTEIYIYGTGDYGKDLKQFLENELNVSITGFVVSDGYKNEEYIQELPVYEICDIENKKEIGVIISVKSEKLQTKMITNLQTAKCKNILCI